MSGRQRAANCRPQRRVAKREASVMVLRVSATLAGRNDSGKSAAAKGSRLR